MGGKAFENVTRRIDLQEIHGTLSWLEQRWPDHSLNVAKSLYNAMLGSAGKNSTSGDIDLNLEITRYDQAVVADQLKTILGEDFVKPRPGNNQIFTAVPIQGNAAKYGYVQVDFMFGDFEWQKFSYFSPGVYDKDNPRQSYTTSGPRSYYKGLYRTELLKALTAFHSDWVLEENGEMIARVGPTFFHDRGAVWRYRHRPMRKDGKGRVKELKELTEEEFLLIYPSAEKARASVITKPEELLNMFFGENFYPAYAETVESLIGQIIWQMSKEDKQLIGQIYAERLNSLKVDFPSPLARDLGVPQCAGKKS